MKTTERRLYSTSNSTIRRVSAIVAALALFSACNNGSSGPSITLNGDVLQLNSKVGKTSSGSFSFENTGSSSLTYSLTIPVADTWLKLAPSSGTLAAKAKQSIEASATCPNMATDLESKLTVAVSSGGSTISKTFTIKLKCEVLDITPEDFAFANAIGVDTDMDVTSVAVMITGIDDTTLVSASNGAVILVNGNTVSTINNNDKLSIRLKSSKLFDTSVSSAVAVGTISKSFTVTTRKEPKLSLSFSPTALSVAKGASGQTVATITRENFDKPVTVTAQNLPTGVSVNDLIIPAGSSTGNLSFTVAGSAMVGGPFDVLVSASGDSKTASQSLKLTITGSSSEAVSIAGYSNISSLVNKTITPQSPMIMGGTTPYTISIAPALPAGLVLNTATGEISGTATVAQALTKHTVTVTDANSKAASTTLDITITAALGIAKPYSTVQGTVGYPIKFPSQASIEGGTKPYNFSINPTTLPTGMSFNAATGALSGAPTALYALKEHVITVKDQSGLQLTLPVKIAVNAAPKFTKGYQSLINQVGHNDNLPQTPEVAGGSLPLQFSVPHLVNKTGLSFDGNTGTLSGLPNIVALEEAYTVTALDLNDAPATTALRVLVTPELAPKVVSSQPASSSSGIDPKIRQIQLNFNEAVDVMAAGVSLKCNGINIPLAGLPATNTSVVVVGWSGDLAKTASCVFNIAQDAVEDSDLADGPDNLEFDYFLTFTTTDDAPSVVATTPINNAVGVVNDSTIKVKFSENVNLQAGAITLQCPLGSPIMLNGLPQSNVSEAELTPATLIPDTGVLCTVTVLKDKLDDSDSIDPPNTLPTDYSFNFSVDAAPTVITATPAQDSINGIATPIVVRFSEPVSIDADVASAACSKLNTPFTASNPSITTQLDVSKTILTIAPNPTWPEAANCSITIDKSKVHDLDSIDPPDSLANTFVRSIKTDASPNDIALAPATIAENQPNNTTVGTLSTVDPDIGQTHSYMFVSGTGATDNTSFTIVGNQLKANTSFDFETKASYTVRIKSTDSGVPPLSVEKQITIMVSNVNEAPAAISDAYSTNEDTMLAVAAGVLSNDTDVDGDNLTAVLVANVGHGSLILNANGGFTYTPSLNYNGPDSFTYKARDPSLFDSNIVTVSIIVTAVDDAPVAVADSATVLEDAIATSVDVLINDTDIDGGPKSIASVTQPTNGTVVITGMGTDLTYQPSANYCGSDNFTYTLNPGSSSATVSIAITCTDDAPVAVADSAKILEDALATSVDVLANDTDIDGGPKSIASATQPANGTVVIVGMGTGVAYKPNTNYCGSDGFTYTLNGGDTATVNITIMCVNDAPVAINDAYSINENATLTIAALGVLSNDSDVDGDNLTAILVANVVNGSLSLNTSGGFTYVSSPNYNGFDSFTYKARDSGPLDSNIVTVNITITAIDTPPVAIIDNAIVVEGAAAATVNVLSNDTDIDGGPKNIISVTQPTNGTVVITGGGTGLTYQPNANYCNSQTGGSADAFSYTLNGGSSTTVSMTVTCAPPTLVTIDDGDADDSVFIYTTLTYTVTFSKDIDSSTVTATDFNNSGTATITIGTIIETSPGIFTVQVTPATVGTIILRIPTGAVIKDLAGNNLAVPTSDDTTVTVIAWKSISAGGAHTCALDNNDKAYCWGYGFFGQLGNIISNNDSDVPLPVTLPTLGITWKSISAGGNHTCAIDNNDKAYCWGDDQYGQLGDSGMSNASKNTPSPVTLPIGTTSWKSISAGSFHTCAIDNTNKAYCWGRESNDQLGDGGSNTSQSSPSLVLGGYTWKSISVNGYNTCAIDTNDKAYCWGNNGFGQLGNGGGNTDSNVPSPVTLPTIGTTWKSISVGFFQICAIDNSNQAYCWGDDLYGQLGNGGVLTASQNTPSLVDVSALPIGTTWKSIGADGNHTCAIDNNNKAYCWGYDVFGQLGDGGMTNANKNTPSPVSLPTGATFWQSINVGFYHTCAIDNTNKAYCWGFDSNSQLGNGALNDMSPFTSNVPSPVTSP
jgi:alpha-tubulin suppressor-like RCC1 family protein